MLETIDRFKNNTYQWISARAESKFVFFWLALISFAESIIFPIPTTAFLLAMFMAGAQRHYYYAFWTSVFSVAGGIAGYILGLLFFDTIGIKIVDFYHLSEELTNAQNLYGDNTFWVTMIGALTPVPYKIFTLTAGFLKVDIIPFILASVIGRSVQFYLVAFVMKKWGKQATELALKYFNYLAILFILLILFLIQH